MIEIQNGVAVSVRAMDIARDSDAVVVAGRAVPRQFPACAVMIPAATWFVGGATISLAAAGAIELLRSGQRPPKATRRGKAGSGAPAEGAWER